MVGEYKTFSWMKCRQIVQPKKFYIHIFSESHAAALSLSLENKVLLLFKTFYYPSPFMSLYTLHFLSYNHGTSIHEYIDVIGDKEIYNK